MWGSGTPMRELLYVDDRSGAIVHILTHCSGERHLNVGTGADVTIHQLAKTVKRVVVFEGELVWDTSKPDGTQRKWRRSPWSMRSVGGPRLSSRQASLTRAIGFLRHFFEVPLIEKLNMRRGSGIKFPK